MFLSLLLGLNKKFYSIILFSKIKYAKNKSTSYKFYLFYNKIYTTYSIEIQLYSTLNTIYSRYLVAPSRFCFMIDKNNLAGVEDNESKL